MKEPRIYNKHYYPGSSIVSACGRWLTAFSFTPQPAHTVNCKLCLAVMTKEVKPNMEKIPEPEVQKKKIEIKPIKMEKDSCPFCGYDKYKVLSMKRESNKNPGQNYQAICNKCKARGPMVADDESKAIDLWLERAE